MGDTETATELFTPLIAGKALSPSAPATDKSSSNGDQVEAGEQYLSLVMPNEDTEAVLRIGDQRLFKEPVSRSPVLSSTLHRTSNALQKSKQGSPLRPRPKPKLGSFLPQLPAAEATGSSPMSIKGLKAPIAANKELAKQVSGY